MYVTVKNLRLGDLSCDFDALYSMAVQFLSLCYGIKPEDQQSSIIPTRIKVLYGTGRSLQTPITIPH